MEDLKKQTALRLAQEHNEPPLQHEIYVSGSGHQQQQGGQFHVRSPNANNNYAFSSSDLLVTPPRRVQHPQDFHSQDNNKQYLADGTPIVYLNPDNEQRQVQRLEQPERQQSHIQQQSGGYLGASGYKHTNGMPPQDQNAMPVGVGGSRMMESHQSDNYTHSVGQQTMTRTVQPLQPTSIASFPPNTMHLQHQQSFISYSPDGPHLSATITRSSNALKSKLPHGLTVHELKEMTKARLQSEAAEKSNEFREVQPISRDRVSPLDFDSGESPRDRAMSRDSSSAGRINSAHATSYFQNHQVAPKIIQTQLQPQSQILQPGGNPSNVPGGATPSSFRAVAARNDTWDSTSVASHNSTIYSDNFNSSESASEVGSFSHSNHRNRSFTYPAVQVVQLLDASNISSNNFGYKDSRSFSNRSPIQPQPQASPHRGAGLIGGQPLINAAVGENRRRAVTLSPNTGSILEDRPLRYDARRGDRLDIPSFSPARADATSLSAAPSAQNQNRGYSPVLEQLGLGLDSSYMSNGTESSGVFRGGTTTVGSSLPGISQMSSREQESLRGFPSNTKNEPDVFRSLSSVETRAAAPPPGFMISSASPRGQTAFSRVGSLDGYCNVRSKDNWEANTNFQINESLQSPEETLISDFGSVLNLSGPDRRDRERASTYTFGSTRSHDNNLHSKENFRF